MQHVVANSGQTEPPLFRAAITSSTFLPLQYYYNDTIPQVCPFPSKRCTQTQLRYELARIDTLQPGSCTSQVCHLTRNATNERSHFILGSCSSAADALACLRAADVSALEMANMNLNLGEFFGTYAFVPVVDGTFIVERPTVTLEKRRVNGVSPAERSFAYAGLWFIDFLSAYVFSGDASSGNKLI